MFNKMYLLTAATIAGSYLAGGNELPSSFNQSIPEIKPSGTTISTPKVDNLVRSAAIASTSLDQTNNEWHEKPFGEFNGGGGGEHRITGKPTNNYEMEVDTVENEGDDRRRLGEHPVIYAERNSGLCTDGGGNYIGSRGECDKAASVLRLSDVYSSTVKGPYYTYPRGCSYKYELWFNTPSSDLACSPSQKCNQSTRKSSTRNSSRR